MGMYVRLRKVSANAVVNLLQSDVESVDIYLEEDEEEADLYHDLDKSWHGIHFVLCGKPWEGPPPLSFLVQGGSDIGSDLGYGPARLFTPAELDELVTALQDFSKERFRSRVALAELTENEVYPNCWDRPEEVDYLTEAFADMCEFLRSAQKEENGLVVMLF